MNENETHIKDIRIYQAVSKLSHPIADSTHDISKIAFYVLEVETIPYQRGDIDERRSDRPGLSFKLPLQSERNRGRFKRYEEIRS